MTGKRMQELILALSTAIVAIMFILLACSTISTQEAIKDDLRGRKHIRERLVDSLISQNTWLKYNDSLSRVERKVTSNKNLSILAKERKFQRGE